MNNPINGGGPAFPEIISTYEANATQPQRLEAGYGFIKTVGGMTLRDFFATSVDMPWEACFETMKLKWPERKGMFKTEEIAAYRAAYRYLEADAMITERNKT